jgi:DNA-directed RNA polymerase subunit RPC12/RpoP
MAYKVPRADVLAEAIRCVLNEQNTVISQNLLAELVNACLKRDDPDYTASEERIRRVTLIRKLARVQIVTREADERSRHARCPVCGAKTKRIQNETVFGGTVTLGYKCRSCGYWTGLRRRVPTRYIFHSESAGPTRIEV